MNLKKWHKAVCERENYVCQGCNKDANFPYYFTEKGINHCVCGHHIKSQKSRPDLREDIDNGMCVCFECHGKIHAGILKSSD